MGEPVIPFSEPPYLSNLPSPYYSESHREWQKICRSFISANLLEHAAEWEDQGEVPPHVYQTFAKATFLIAALPSPLPVAALRKLGISHLPGKLRIQDYDYLHYLIFIDELARSGFTGPASAIITGFAFGVPPIIKFGSESLQDRFLPDIFSGRKRICIAITEPEYIPSKRI